MLTPEELESGEGRMVSLAGRGVKELEAGEGRMVRLASRGVGRSQSLTEKTDCSPGHEMNLREQAWA